MLWAEGRDGTGRDIQSRAIPVEYVKGVIEVKSSFDANTAEDAVEHLCDLSYLLESLDREDAPYKQFLPKDYICLLVFFELRSNPYLPDARRAASAKRTIRQALDKLHEAEKLRGYRGSLVLRGAGRPDLETARPTWAYVSLPNSSSMAGNHQLVNVADIGDDVVLSSQFSLDDESTWKLFMAWNTGGFAHFAFDLLAMLKGTYQPGQLSSPYGSELSPLPSNVLQVPTHIKPFLQEQQQLDQGLAL